MEESVADDPYELMKKVHKKTVEVERRRGNALALTGGDDRAYADFEKGDEARKEKSGAKNRHALFKSRQKENPA